MINWGSLAGNALWIFGCAMALSILSYASWQASLKRTKLFAQLSHIGIIRAFYVAGLLFCAGLAMTSNTIIEIILWVILGILFCLALFLPWRQVEKEGEETSNQS